MRDDVTLDHHYSLDGRIHKMVPDSINCNICDICSSSWPHSDLVQGCMCGISNMFARQISQSCTKPLMHSFTMTCHSWWHVIYDLWGIHGQTSQEVEPSMTQPCSIVLLPSLTHWGWDKMADISQTTFSHAFSWMKIYEFRLRFHWNFSPRFQLMIFQHWFR